MKNQIPWAVILLFYMAKAIAEEPTEDLSNGKSHVPPSCSLGLFVTSIPLRSENCEMSGDSMIPKKARQVIRDAKLRQPAIHMSSALH
jgi:hypothetical protein